MSRRARKLLLLFATLALTAIAGPPAHARPSNGKKSRPSGSSASARSKAVPERSAADKSDAKSAAAGKSAAVTTLDADSDGSAASTTTAGGKTLKTKTYTFGAMDVEGKLKTPQLLYFLDRVKLELDMSAPDKRSFIKELEKSADDSSL
ncbi:MAG TPA: hypothetical protein VH374_24415 [Polyangia bacterium]|jgi:hypothetical protein|nr:hypothetical protein [Polyangia bacterium]